MTKVTYKLQEEKVIFKSWNDPHPEHIWVDLKLRGKIEYDSQAEIILALQYCCVPTIRLIIITHQTITTEVVSEHIFGEV